MYMVIRDHCVRGTIDPGGDSRLPFVSPDVCSNCIVVCRCSSRCFVEQWTQSVSTGDIEILYYTRLQRTLFIGRYE